MSNDGAEYVASFSYAHQYSPEDWRTELHTMTCTPETTLAEIHDWKRRRTKYKDVELLVLISQAT